MNATRPEAETEYSRAQPPATRGFGRLIGRRDDRPGGGFRALELAVLVGGGIGAGLLLVAEFMPLLNVRSSTGHGVIDTVSTGPHDAYALVPVALLAAALAYGLWRTRSRVALFAIALLGVLVLLIALVRDLPDAQATGLIGTAATHFTLASSTPATGLYLETLGAIVLLITAVGGLLLAPAGAEAGGRAGPSADRTRSAS